MFSLVQFHGWDAHYIESLAPYEKHVYVDMLTKHLKHEAEIQRDAAVARKNQRRK